VNPRQPMDRRRDPRSIVTPYAFAVHPDLLGRPLATPWQRLAAILIDGVVILILTLVGGGWLAVASTILLFWIAFRKPSRDVLGKVFRIAVGCLGLSILVVATLVVLAVRNQDQLRRVAEEIGNSAQEQSTEPGRPSGPSSEGREGLGTAIGAIQGAFAFGDAETQEEAQAIATRLARNARELNLPRGEVRGLLTELMPDDAPWADSSGVIIDQAMASLDASQERPAEAGTPTETGAPTETAAAPQGLGEEEEVGAPLDPAALDSIEALNQELLRQNEALKDAQEAAETAEKALEESRNSSGIFGWLFDLVDELGLGFGWGALYLTITHAWWKGSSIGKKILGIRVVMIDMRPLNWWLSFERAGGYAAGLATGLLGFAQIFWDPNRQAIHDKVSETIVIQEGKDPVPGPWMEEGKANWARATRPVAGNAPPG